MTVKYHIFLSNYLLVLKYLIKAIPCAPTKIRAIRKRAATKSTENICSEMECCNFFYLQSLHRASI